MRLSATRVFPLALMLSLALLSFWLERTARESPTAATTNRHDSDYSVERFTITDYGKDGAPEWALSGVRMVHYPDDDSTALTAPQVVQTLPGQPRLELTADRGTLSRDAEEVFLYDNVLLVRAPEPGASEARARTSYLHVRTSRGLATTDREVQIEEQGRTLNGRGMELDNAARRLTLHAQVRVRFEANHP